MQTQTTVQFDTRRTALGAFNALYAQYGNHFTAANKGERRFESRDGQTCFVLAGTDITVTGPDAASHINN